MMKPERMNQILIEAIGLPPDVPIEVMTLKSVSANIALTAMQRAVEEETATLRAEVENMTLQRDSLRSEVQNYHAGQTALLKEVERLKGVIPTNEEIAIEVVARFMHNPHPNQRDKYAREKKAFIDGVEWITQRHTPKN